MSRIAVESLAPPIEAINEIVRLALLEDAADRDRTSALIDPDLIVDGSIVARHPVVLCGGAAIEAALGTSTILVSDGEVAIGEIARFSGRARRILSSERTILNVLGHLSGISTLTRRYVDQITEGSKTKILDTRKTLPGLRALEKYAVRCGGGFNHRMNLAEMIFIKDNHLAVIDNDSFVEGRERLRDYVIIEVDRLDQLEGILKYHPNRVLLDNFSDDDIAEAIGLIGDRAEIEVSGGITLERIRPLSNLNVDYVSIGALTHSAPCADLSLEIKNL